MRESWLNGWTRKNQDVLIGSALHCAGCGKIRGVICVVFDGSPLPEKDPDWPFEEKDCPLCWLEKWPEEERQLNLRTAKTNFAKFESKIAGSHET